ncbi:MAG: paraquat-inducible protein A [Gammaproteobacteria bacterium]|nr:paraquat-inducible protein A [Gammaproteobacteria bacterium]
MPLQHRFGLLLLLIAYGLLIPGLTEPVLHIVTTLDKAVLTALGKEAIVSSGSIPSFLMPMTKEVLDSIEVTGLMTIQDTAKSILGTSRDLWQEGNGFVAGLILLFSVLIPIIKIALLASSVLFKHLGWYTRPRYWSGVLSKWSMADVFVMALIISFLAIKASASSSGLVDTQMSFEVGFYYFVGYCLLSIVATQLLLSVPSKQV